MVPFIQYGARVYKMRRKVKKGDFLVFEIFLRIKDLIELSRHKIYNFGL